LESIELQRVAAAARAVNQHLASFATAGRGTTWKLREGEDDGEGSEKLPNAHVSAK